MKAASSTFLRFICALAFTLDLMPGQVARAAASETQAPPAAASSIVALDIDIVLDQVSAEEPMSKVGEHHLCRIYYDARQVDPATKRVRVLHQQHTGMLIPKHLNPLQEPMSNAWLDLSRQPYHYHMAASPVQASFPFAYAILFDENTMRMTIRKQSDGSLLLAGPYTINPKPITGPEVDAVVASSDPVKMPWEKEPTMGMAPEGVRGSGAPPQRPESAPTGAPTNQPQGKAPSPESGISLSDPNIVTLAMDVKLDQVADEDKAMFRVGGHDLDRIAYDKTKVDSVSHKVPIVYLGHYMGGMWSTTTPTATSTLDMSSTPYKLTFAASVNHGSPIVVLFEGVNRRMAILSRPDFHMLIAGEYTIDPTPLTAEQIKAPPPNANSPDTMPILSNRTRP